MNHSRRTIIYTHGGGRLGNQIIRHAHWLAWMRAHPGQATLVNMAFWPFASLFATWRNHPGCGFPFGQKWADKLARTYTRLPDGVRIRSESHHRLARAVHLVGRSWPGWQSIALDDSRERIAMEEPAFLSRLMASRVTIVSGWKLANWRLVAEQQVELREFFRPHPNWMRVAEPFIANLRQRHDVVIGLFVRQGDYRLWWDGRFCFSTRRYVEWIRQLLDLHPGRCPAVVIASEEKLDSALFAGLPCYFTTGSANSSGHWFESWVELSLCDLIVSPPSTFSATAAFAGAKSLWPVFSADQNLSFDQIMRNGMIDAAVDPVFSLAVQ